MSTGTNMIIPDKMLDRIIKDRRIRTEIARRSHLLFFSAYFADYLQFPLAPFHYELLALTDDPEWHLLCLAGFRNSAKTTILVTSYSLYAVLGVQQKKFVLILCQTRSQAKQEMANIRGVVERNTLLRRDLGPFREEDSEWGSSSIVFSRLGARITVASVEQSVRGLRHFQHRPDLILLDDVEDLSAVKTKEGREKTYQWYKGEIIPAGDRGTRTIIIGNVLHEDCLVMRIRREVEEGSPGIVRWYPLLDEGNRIAWPGKYPTMVAVEEERRKIANESVWQREYLLRIITDEDQAVHPDWIHYYDVLPDDGKYSDFRFAATGVDLAISERETADYTAMVSAKVYGRRQGLRIYILPNPVNERLDFPKTLARAKRVSRTLGGGMPTRLYIEGTAYQRALVDQLRHENYPAEEFRPQGEDKRARLMLTTNLIQSGEVLFPAKGAEPLIQQLLGFGKERHDDLVDAFCFLILKILEFDAIAIKGYRPLLAQDDLDRAYVKEMPHVGDRRLGIVIAGGGRGYSVVVMRSDNVAEVLWRETTDDPMMVATKIITIAGEQQIPLDSRHLFPEETGVGREYCAKLNELVTGQRLGLNGGDPPESVEKYVNRRTQGYWRMAEWIKQGGKLIGKPLFDEILDAQYKVQPDDKVKIAGREELLDAGVASPDVADALALTFFRKKDPIFKPLRPSPWEPMSVYEGRLPPGPFREFI